MIAKQIKDNQIDHTVDQMKTMNLSEDVVAKIQAKLEQEARDNVRALQGQEAYETFD